MPSPGPRGRQCDDAISSKLLPVQYYQLVNRPHERRTQIESIASLSFRSNREQRQIMSLFLMNCGSLASRRTATSSSMGADLTPAPINFLTWLPRLLCLMSMRLFAVALREFAPHSEQRKQSQSSVSRTTWLAQD